MIFRQLAKDSAIYGGGDFLGKIIAFFTFPIVASALAPEAFGALELILTTAALLGLFINCGLNNSTQRFYWDQDTPIEKRPVVVSTGFFVLFILSLAGFIVGLITVFIFSPLITDQTFKLSLIGLISALLLMVFTQWQGYILDVIRLHFAPFRFLTVSLASRALTAILAMVAVVYYNLGLDGYLGVQAFAVFAVIPVSIYFIKKDLVLSFNREWASKLVGFGYPFIFASLAYWLFGSMDRWMLASLSSLEETGLYSIAYRFSSIVLFVSTAFGMAWSPVAIKVKTDNPSGYREIYAQVLFLILFVMLIIGGGLAMFSGEIMFFIMTNEYARSALPLSVLCFGVILQATQHVTAIGISLERKTYLFARVAWITAGVNLVLNWLLIPLYGALGAAIATTCSYMVITVCYLYYTQKLHPLPIRWKRLAALSGLGIIIAVVAIYFNDFSFDIRIAGFKLFISFICLWLGWLILPVKKLKLLA